jgi:hypothetical protein
MIPEMISSGRKTITGYYPQEALSFFFFQPSHHGSGKGCGCCREFPFTPSIFKAWAFWPEMAVRYSILMNVP